MNKILTIGIAVALFIAVSGYVHAQSATPSVSPTPTTTVPSGAPSTGFGK